MKRNLLVILTILACISIVFIVLYMNKESSVNEESISSGTAKNEAALRAFAERMRGVWIYEQNDSLRVLHPFENHEMLIQINPLDRVDGQLKVKVSKYCFPGEADYLHFTYTDNHLAYVKASKTGEIFQLKQVVDLDLSERIISGDTLLVFESKEALQNDSEKKYLRRVDKLNLESSYWACGFQSYLEDFLRFGAYTVYDHRSNTRLENPIFDTFEPQIEFEYLAPFMPYFPMYEEYCIRADFPIVVLQSLKTEPPSKIFAIEWKRDRIDLYETGISENSIDGAFPIRIKSLAFSLIYL